MCNFCCTFAHRNALHDIMGGYKIQMNMNIPTQPEMAVSLLNMKLRDEYQSLEELCEDMDINIDELCQKLRNAGYEYNAACKRFW